MSLTRRQMLQVTGAAIVGASAAHLVKAGAQGPTKKLLFFTKSSGFEHSVVRREGTAPAFAERIMIDLGKSHGYDVTVSKDGAVFEPDQIGEFDAFALYTTGDLTQPGRDQNPPMSPRGLEAFFEAVLDGKGLVGMHCASDTFHSPKNGPVSRFVKLIGGEFSGHGPQESCKLFITDSEFPGVAPFGTEFELFEEWYAQKNLGDDLRVLIAHDTESMDHPLYERPNFPETWLRTEQKARIFYTSMGHREDVWTSELFQGLVLGGLAWATGQVEVDTTPNIKEVTPGYSKGTSA